MIVKLLYLSALLLVFVVVVVVVVSKSRWFCLNGFSTRFYEDLHGRKWRIIIIGKI